MEIRPKMLDIVYFAWVREAIGLDGETIDRPDGAHTVQDIINSLLARGQGYEIALGNSGRLRAALDQQFVPLDTPIGSARELALFPPVTGG